MIAQITGSLETGLIVLCLVTVVGVVAGLFYSSSPGPRADAQVINP